MSLRRSFPRRIDSLDALFAFAAQAVSGRALDTRQHHSLDFALEELFTNMVKYSPSGAPSIEVDIGFTDEGVEVMLMDRDVERFDVTRAAAVRTDLPVEQRQPGGLGLQLLRQLVDRLDYDYRPAQREGRTTFLISLRPRDGRPPC